MERLAEEVARSPESTPGRRAIAVRLLGDLDRSLADPAPTAPSDLLAGRAFSEAAAAEFAARGWEAHPTRCARLIEYGRRHAPDELRSALRTRIDWGFAHHRSRGCTVEDYEAGRNSPWATLHDEMLLALWELGGRLHPHELRRLEYYGYACDPWKRLQEILAGE